MVGPLPIGLHALRTLILKVGADPLFLHRCLRSTQALPISSLKHPTLGSNQLLTRTMNHLLLPLNTAEGFNKFYFFLPWKGRNDTEK